MFFEPSDAALDGVASAVGGAVKIQWSSAVTFQLVAALGDDRLYAVGTQPAANAWGTIGFVAGKASWAAQRPAVCTLETGLVHQDFEASGFMLLTGSEMGCQRDAPAIGEYMEFGAETTPGAS